MAAVTIWSDFGAPKIKSATVPTVSSFICHEVMGLDAMILVFWMLSFKPTCRLSSFTFLKFFFTFCHKDGGKSEVIDISPGNLDSSLCFIQPSISRDVCSLQDFFFSLKSILDRSGGQFWYVSVEMLESFFLLKSHDSLWYFNLQFQPRLGITVILKM